jgi:glucan phosphoethanolaminetransferase (alkaline phosphatase superfamily)
VSAVPDDRQTPGEVIGGLLAAVSIFTSVASVVFHPLRLVLLSIVLALVSAAMARTSTRLPAIAIGVGAAAFVVGMTIAVAGGRPLW